ncbi:MAG: hypothetical protein GWN86_23320 [Desulfobacterales bacterium]|nr:hypothetical protein [Desulfobacterales bacterium]
MKDNEVNLYKDGNVFGVETTCMDRGNFMYKVAEKLSELIDDGRFKDDWQFQLQGWLLHIGNICNTYRALGSCPTGEVFYSGDTSEKNLVI